jgi:hypothetical protein
LRLRLRVSKQRAIVDRDLAVADCPRFQPCRPRRSIARTGLTSARFSSAAHRRTWRPPNGPVESEFLNKRNHPVWMAPTCPRDRLLGNAAHFGRGSAEDPAGARSCQGGEIRRHAASLAAALNVVGRSLWPCPRGPRTACEPAARIGTGRLEVSRSLRFVMARSFRLGTKFPDSSRP